MDIRTKLVITLIAVSLGSMWLLGFFAYQTSASMLQDITERQLDALAESKARDLSKVIESWRDRTRLVASRTQLRINLDHYNAGDRSAVQQMTRILSDAHESTPSVAAVSLFDASGNFVTSVGNAATQAPHEHPGLSNLHYLGIVSIAVQSWVSYYAPLQLEGRDVGHVVVTFSAEDLLSVTEDYSALGEYGETIVAMRNEQGEIRMLHPLRHDTPITLSGTDSGFLVDAVSGVEGIYTDAQFSYRGMPVWAATRFIEDVEWGLVVQADTEEQLIPVTNLRRSMINLGLSLSAFAILGGTLLGIYLSGPLLRLAELVNRVRDGETSLRAEVKSEDEIGQLAGALNEFLDQREAAPKQEP